MTATEQEAALTQEVCQLVTVVQQQNAVEALASVDAVALAQAATA